jgi:gas vesicle protein
MENIRGLTYFCLGCAAGAVAAVFLTPKSGPETIAYLRRKAEDGTNYLKQGTNYIKRSVDDASDAVTKVAERGKKTVRFQAENLGAAVEAGKQAYKTAQQTTP